MEEPREVETNSPEALGEEPDAEEDDLKVQLFLEYLKMQDEGYEGSFDDFVGKDLRRELDEAIEALEPDAVTEEAVARSESESYVLAVVENVRESHPLYTTLGSGETRVQGVEHLLSALEMMGVDNARIEIEGGHEVPIVDGSAVGWAIEVQAAGVSRAMVPSAQGEKEGGKKRRVPLVDRPILVTGEDGAFISYVPGDRLQLSAGVDHAEECAIIGRQFFSWAYIPGSEKDHYRWQFASARNYSPSPNALQQLRADGYIKGGTQMCTVLGAGDRWFDTQMVRFFNDEPARHKLVDLTGDMSLLASPGNGGVPNGHTTAFQADHELSLKFLRAMAAAISGHD